MYNNQATYGVNPYMMGGPQFQQPPQARMTQPLTIEQIKALRTNAPAFTLDISEEDMLRARCTHKMDGKFTLVFNNDAEGSVTCSICGERFVPTEIPVENVQQATSVITDILQTIKTNYLDMPNQVAIEYFQIIPFIEKIPKLYSIALENFNKYEGNGIVNPNQNMSGFNMLGAIASPSYAGFGMGQPYAQPMMQQAPMGYQQPMMGANPFGYTGGYVQPQQQYAPQPQQPVVQQPEVTADPTGMVQGKVFNV